MTQGASKLYLFVFAIGLLLCGCVIRSGVLVDKSLLPRFLGVSLLLLTACLTTFRKKWVLQGNFFIVAFILYYLWNLISGFWAISPSEAIMQSQMVFLSLALFLIVSEIYHENASFENIFIKTHLFVLLFSFALAFYKMSTLVYFDPYKIISVSANNNLYAGFLVISLPFVFTGYSINKGFWKYVSVLVAILAIFFIIIVQSRAAYLGLAAALVFSAILMFRRYRSVFSGKNISVGIVALVFLSAGVFMFYSSLDVVRKNYFLSKIPVWQYFKSYDNANMEKLLKQRNAVKAGNSRMPEFDFAEAYYENANLRVIFWKKSACLMKLNPIAGVGAGNWRLNIPSCREPVNPEHTIRNYTYSQPHNEWISIMSELGLVGFLLAVVIFFIPVIIALYRISFTVPKPHISAVFYSAFIIGFYLFAFFDFPLKRIEHNVLLFSIFAFLFQKIPVKQMKIKLFPNMLFPFLFLVALLFTIFIASARIRGEYFTLKMFRNEGKNDGNVIEYCQKAENTFYLITPNTLPLAWFEGVARYHRGEAGTALNCFQRALKSTPYEVRVLNDYAAALFSLKKVKEAKTVLLRTIELDPFFDDARFNLGAMYYFTGNRDSALFQVNQCRQSQKKADFLKELEAPPGYPQ